MKELPILMNTEMVRATLDGRKTQTRRPMTPKQLEPIRFQSNPFNTALLVPQPTMLDKSPFGAPGDHLYVRETWAIASWFAQVGSETHRFEGVRRRATDSKNGVARWRPSIHMPKWASRITLEVERVW